MQPTSRKTSSDTKIRKGKIDESKKLQDEKLKKSVYTISTPREYVSKTSATDIYAQKKSVGAKAPKKVPGVSSTSNVSPMKGLLKSSASSISQISRTSDVTPAKKLEARNLHSASDTKSIHSTRKKENTGKKELFTNVTVNSPVVKRKLDLNTERTKEVLNKKVSKTNEVGNAEQRRSKEAKAKEFGNREPKRSKEVETYNEKQERQRTKTRTLDKSEVKILTPDYVDNNVEMLNLSKKLVAKPKAFYVDLDEEKAKSETKNEKSDDEDVSYEDDFESYESDFDSYHSDGSEASRSETSEHGEQSDTNEASAESGLKEKYEERMLDSEDAEKSLLEDTKKSLEDTKKSLDEGFQDMSSSTSSMRTVDVLDRPLFIDFTKSKQNKIKRKFNELLKQRANDLLGMITLHEMTYSLYEMQPISYDLYMATFGRSNYTQSGVQTFDDGINQEVQTDEVSVCQKWTQYPIEFSKHDIYQNKDSTVRKYSQNTEDYLTKFTFMVKENYDDQSNGQITSDENYKQNPLRILLEQKDGVGSVEMLPFETYKSKLKSNDYNVNRLSKFMKKFESRVSHILSKNTGSKELTDLKKSRKLLFSKGHVTISPKSLEEPKYTFLISSKITKVFFSETKSNLLLSLHLWDLSEEPSWRDSVASEKKSTELVEVQSASTQVETDREWNLRNSKKKASKDIGKAFWSKLKLEKYQTINITEHIDTTIKDNTHFNLNSAKRRISQRKQEKSLLKKDTFRPKTATTFDFDIDRPYSAASLRKKVLPAEINLPKSWENGIVCSDLKIVSLNNVYSFLVAKNCGEVLCCKRCLGVVRVQRFSVATDTSSITSLDVCSEGLPYFLAASDAGTVSLCSLLDSRVLLALDCR
ncbi:WD repeat-containing protein 60 [Operophtera brumata]|uniref:WD repeat-containing protein 60 n=1 Tax=Operophtera brumata TaxID=104452 RepID=A0A0L7L1D4_OPEBR|nr:WD repeat-containing protein 60 [Operophtera brumata]